MSKEDRIILSFICILFVLLGISVLKTAENIREYTEQKRIELEVTEQKKEELKQEDIRVKCAVYYNDGTGRWKECMGVGYK